MQTRAMVARALHCPCYVRCGVRVLVARCPSEHASAHFHILQRLPSHFKGCMHINTLKITINSLLLEAEIEFSRKLCDWWWWQACP
mmetsp:Transcript_41111/g.66203  ORF Transcript_41111/g.66203 Transcript_41111/m.66203 type:complete len:86 (-) Transcript_41111:275-532(-)